MNEVVVWSRNGRLPVKCYIIGWNVFAISTIGWNNLKASEHVTFQWMLTLQRSKTPAWDPEFAVKVLLFGVGL